MAICDAKYIFRFIDIGAYGRRSDGGIFKESTMGQKFRTKQMNIPEPTAISPGGPALPYCLVGDEAFPLTEYLLRPYPGRVGLDQDRTMFNYRLSRARRTIENTFGILAAQWRILRRPINCSVDKTMLIVQSIVCLHNWLRRQDIDKNVYVPESMIDRENEDGVIPGSWRVDVNNQCALQNVTNCGTNTHSRKVSMIRDEFCKYFNGEDAIPWQFYNC